MEDQHQPLAPQPPEQAAAPTPASEPSSPAPAATPVPATSQGTDVMGIVSIVLAFIGFSLIGFVVGLVGASKAKREGRSPVLSRIGWIINLVITVFIGLFLISIIFMAGPRIQEAARDTARHNDLLRISSALENYYDTKGYYPADLTALGPDVPRADSSGRTYRYTPKPAGCTQCTGYQLQATMDSGTPKTIDSLRPGTRPDTNVD